MFVIVAPAFGDPQPEGTSGTSPRAARAVWWKLPSSEASTTRIPPIGNSEHDGDDLVVLCHCPPGNRGQCRTKELPPRAAEAHFAHGDQPGPCPEATPTEP